MLAGDTVNTCVEQYSGTDQSTPHYALKPISEIPKTPFHVFIYIHAPLAFRFPISPLQFEPRVSLCVLQLHQELASSQETLEDSGNKVLVTALYDALKSRDAATIQKILAPDLEWWFHGPPSHQFLMRLLTGEQDSNFRFVPHSISAFGSTVLAEGFDQTLSIAWVHAWTVTDGIITQVREYFNTSLTVTRVGKADQSDCGIASLHCPSVWESSLPDRVGKSVPALVLAI